MTSVPVLGPKMGTHNLAHYNIDIEPSLKKFQEYLQSIEGKMKKASCLSHNHRHQQTLNVIQFVQSVCSLPHTKKVNKSSVNLKTHLTGVIMHGHGSSGYLDYMQWPHDPNLTMNILLKALVGQLSTKTTVQFPKKLFVQLDNCGRENKNHYVLAFLSLLVELDIFQEVRKHYTLILSVYNFFTSRLSWAS